MIYKKNKLLIDGFDVGFLGRKFKTPIELVFEVSISKVEQKSII